MLEYMEIFIVNLIIPVVMLFGGYMMKTCPPRSISHWVGFRTALSMKNADTWAFAHACCGRVWWKAGWISLVLSVLVQLPFESICDFLGISAAYFSTVFKRETGKTFINYLTDIRMDRAVHMLLDENEKTYVIAEAVGYSDPNYFSYAFKKKFGVSPSKYKAQQQAGTAPA